MVGTWPPQGPSHNLLALLQTSSLLALVREGSGDRAVRRVLVGAGPPRAWTASCLLRIGCLQVRCSAGIPNPCLKMLRVVAVLLLKGVG